MGRADIERVIRQLSGQLARPQLVNTLVEVRKRVISTRPGLEEFVRLGGLTPLTELLKQPQPADVFNVALSVLGNCTARPAGRQHFVQHGGLHAVLNVVNLRARVLGMGLLITDCLEVGIREFYPRDVEYRSSATFWVSA